MPKREGTKSSSMSGPEIISGSDARTFIGGNLNWLWERLIRGGSSGHPLGNPVRFRWIRDTDTYVLRAVEDAPALRLFRRSGQWRIAFDTQALTGDTYLFESDHLDEPIYTPVALIYAMQVAAYPNLRSAAMQRIMEPS